LQGYDRAAKQNHKIENDEETFPTTNNEGDGDENLQRQKMEASKLNGL
jgi:hypothetical protein